jgi:hypothetical protein
MSDQTITLTLHEKQASENFIKISYTANDATTTKEIQLTGDQEADNTLMNTLFSDLLPKNWIEQYKDINSSPISPVPVPVPVSEPLSEAENNAVKLRNMQRGRVYSDILPIENIISALSTNKSSIIKFNIHVIKTLLNKLTSDYSKNIKKEILTTESLKTDFDYGINLPSVKTYILNMAQNPRTYDNNNYNLIEQVFTPEFLKKYAGNITNWGREVLLNPEITDTEFSPMSKFSSGGNNSTQKIHKINNNKTSKKNK